MLSFNHVIKSLGERKIQLYLEESSERVSELSKINHVVTQLKSLIPENNFCDNGRRWRSQLEILRANESSFSKNIY